MSKKKAKSNGNRANYVEVDEATFNNGETTVKETTEEIIEPDEVVKSTETNEEPEMIVSPITSHEEEVKEEVVEEKQEVIEETPVIENTTNKGGKVIVKEPPKKFNEKKAGRCRIVILKNGTVLQSIRVRKKLDKIKFNYIWDESTNTFTSQEFGRREEAIAVKKMLLTKGLRPVIEDL